MKFTTPLATLGLALIAALPITFATTAQDTPVAAEVERVAPVTVIAIRHAEKGSDDPRDPGLTEAGTARAKDLAAMLAESGVTHIYSTPYRRTTDTVTPLAEALGIEITRYSPADMPGFIKSLGELPSGSVAVVSGHSNTTPGVVIDLGGKISKIGSYRGAPALGEEEYNRMFMVTLATESSLAKSVELHYGASESH